MTDQFVRQFDEEPRQFQVKIDFDEEPIRKVIEEAGFKATDERVDAMWMAIQERLSDKYGGCGCPDEIKDYIIGTADSVVDCVGLDVIGEGEEEEEQA